MKAKYIVEKNDYRNDTKKIQAWISYHLDFIKRFGWPDPDEPKCGMYLCPSFPMDKKKDKWASLNMSEMEEACAALREAGWVVWKVNPERCSLDKSPSYYIARA